MLNYFKFKDENKTWVEITREERFFCSELFRDIKRDIKCFVKFLNDNCDVKLEENTYWEIGYEVCFYRDLIKAKGSSIKKYNQDNKTKYPPKRTFDLCLFSDDKIVIIEAKADQKFKKTQLDDLKKDIDFIPKILKDCAPKIQVDSIFLCSSENKQKFEDFNNFEGKKISWIKLYDLYNNNKNYKRADELGKSKRIKK